MENNQSNFVQKIVFLKYLLTSLFVKKEVDFKTITNNRFRTDLVYDRSHLYNAILKKHSVKIGKVNMQME